MNAMKNRRVSSFVCSLLWACAASLSVAMAAFGSSKPASVVSKPALTVAVVPVSRTTLPTRFSANGAVAAWQEVVVGAQVGGLRVQELKANVGDAVRMGQVLATFATETVQADVALAQANVAEAQANAAEAAANAERARSLQGSGALSAQQMDQYLTQEQATRARLASAQAQLSSQEIRLKQTQLLAPDDGVVSARAGTVGAVVGAGTEMFRLIRRSRLEWRAEVTAADLERIKPGHKVVVKSPLGATRAGVVRTVAPTVDNATRKGLVYVDLPGTAPAAFKPGMYVGGDFELGTTTALTVPQSAVVVRDGFAYVYRLGSDSRVAQTKVQTGRLVGEQQELLSGVQLGEKVVASGGSFLSDGDLVRVVAVPESSPTTTPKNAPQTTPQTSPPAPNK